jgi:hypothetical protein
MLAAPAEHSQVRDLAFWLEMCGVTFYGPKAPQPFG